MKEPINAPAPIIDTHTHLDDTAFTPDLDAVVEQSRAAGIRRFINIGYSPESWQSSHELQDRFPDVISVALGLHPQQADRFNPELARALSHAVVDSGALGIGETGFDFARSQPGFVEQERAFRGQLEIASREGLPTIIHQRGAAKELIAELDRWPGLAPIVLHSFDGTDLLADWAVERGCFIGIGGLAARRRSTALRALLANMPVNRLLLETDAPYLSPPGGGKRNTPSNLRVIAGILAPIWQLSEEELCQATTENAVALFGLSEADGAASVIRDDRKHEPPTTIGNGEPGKDSRALRPLAS